MVLIHLRGFVLAGTLALQSHLLTCNLVNRHSYVKAFHAGKQAIPSQNEAERGVDRMDYSAYIAVLAFWFVAPGGGSFLIASS